MNFERVHALKVLTVDDSALLRGAVRSLFETDDVLEVCGEAENGREAVEKTTHLRPEPVVIDLEMPLLKGLDATRAIRCLKAGVPVILFSGFSNVLEEGSAICGHFSPDLQIRPVEAYRRGPPAENQFVHFPRSSSLSGAYDFKFFRCWRRRERPCLRSASKSSPSLAMWTGSS
jgi:CheY-like chemotaxis protein